MPTIHVAHKAGWMHLSWGGSLPGISESDLGPRLDKSADEKAVAPHEKRVGSSAPKTGEGRIDLAAGAGIKNSNFQPHGARSGFRVSQCGLGSRRIRGINEHGDASRSAAQFTPELQPLCHQLRA